MRSEPFGGGSLWLDTGEDTAEGWKTTNLDLAVIEGTYTRDYGGGTMTTYEWHLVEQR